MPSNLSQVSVVLLREEVHFLSHTCHILYLYLYVLKVFLMKRNEYGNSTYRICRGITKILLKDGIIRGIVSYQLKCFKYLSNQYSNMIGPRTQVRLE